MIIAFELPTIDKKQNNLREWVKKWQIAMKCRKLKAVSEETRADQLLRQLESLKASIRATVEHPFHVVKNLFHYRKVRYKGRAKNTAHLHRLFALANLVIAKRRLWRSVAKLRLEEDESPGTGQKA